MTEDHAAKRTLRRPGGVRRESGHVSGDELVAFGPPPGGQTLPLVVRPRLDGVDLPAWARGARDELHGLLATHGALLFRGFDVAGLSAFAELVKAVSGELLEYRERSSPRTQVTDKIYTSTEYPAHQSIFLHNENSYAHTWPMKLFFFCAVAPERAGETPVADCRQVFRAIDPAVRDRFTEKRVLYVRNFSERLGLPWQTAFGTSDRAAVEAQCRQAGYDVEWTGESGLRTKRIGQAVARHPRTGELSWFNHATFFHVSTLAPDVRDALLSQVAEADLPNHTYYGDGSPIEASVLDDLRHAYLQAKVAVPWQTGDILLIDNVLAAHGREPYAGPRQIRVAMAEACSEPGI